MAHSQHAPKGGPLDRCTAGLCLFVTFLATKADEGKFFYHFDLAQAAEVGPMVPSSNFCGVTLICRLPVPVTNNQSIFVEPTFFSYILGFKSKVPIALPTSPAAASLLSNFNFMAIAGQSWQMSGALIAFRSFQKAKPVSSTICNTAQVRVA